MRMLAWMVTVMVSLSGMSCAVGADDYSPESIVALERSALDRHAIPVSSFPVRARAVADAGRPAPPPAIGA